MYFIYVDIIRLYKTQKLKTNLLFVSWKETKECHVVFLRWVGAEKGGVGGQ